MSASKPSHWQLRLQTAWMSRGAMAKLLLPVAWIYGGLMQIRRCLHHAGLTARHRMPVPVVVVGNLIVGGAGKTPTVLAIVRMLRQQGWTPGIVSRGHGGSATGATVVSDRSPASQVGDEPLLLRLRSSAPVVVGRDRVGAVKALLASDGRVDIVVSDDGLQHRRLGRDVEVMVFDDRGVGNGWLLPAGPLREPLPRRLDAGTIVLYNTEAPSTALPGHMARRALAGAVEWPAWREGEPASRDALALLKNRPVLAVAGIARPERFFDMLRAAGLQITPHPLPDHHDYRTLPWPADTADVVLTEKDAVKLRNEQCGATRVWVVPLDFEPDASFAPALSALLPSPPIR